MSSVESLRGMPPGKRKLLGQTDSSLTKRSRTDDCLGGNKWSRRQPGEGLLKQEQPMAQYLTNRWEPVVNRPREAVCNRLPPVSFESTYGRMRLAEPCGEEIIRHPHVIAPAVPHTFPSSPLIGSQVSYEPFRHPVG